MLHETELQPVFDSIIEAADIAVGKGVSPLQVWGAISERTIAMFVLSVERRTPDAVKTDEVRAQLVDHLVKRAMAMISDGDTFLGDLPGGQPQ